MKQPELTLLVRMAALHEECGKVLDEASAFLLGHGHGGPPDEIDGPLRLALMGQYNAGKSTLVNALLGADIAKTGDAPETQEAHTYRHDGLEIVDLPGSEARAHEQQIARAALVEAHAVIYVVSSQTGLDYKAFWSDLKWLEESSFPYVLVINDRTPHEDESEEQRARTRLLSRFAEEARANLGHSDRMALWVNARRALNGQVNDRPALVERSGIAELEATLETTLRRSEALLRGRRRLADCLVRVRAVGRDLEEKLVGPRERMLARLLERVDETRERLTAKAVSIADEQLAALADVVSASLARAVEAKDGDRTKTASTVDEVVRTTFNAAAEIYENECGAQLHTLAAEAQDELGGSQFDRHINVSVGSVPGASPANFDVMDIVKKHLGHGRQPAANAAKNAAEAAFEGAGKSAAKRAGQIVGGVVVVGIAVLEIYQGYRAADRQRDAIASATREVEARGRQIASLVRHQFLARAASYAAERLDPLHRSLRDRLEHEAGETHLARRGISRAAALRTRIDAMLAEMGELSR